MSSVDNALRRALRQLASGSATVWQPELTTGQAARAETMRQVTDRGGVAAAYVFSEDLFDPYYKAANGAVPDLDAAPWTKYDYGAVSATVSGGVLSVTV